jgi:hypothetical protein
VGEDDRVALRGEGAHLVLEGLDLVRVERGRVGDRCQRGQLDGLHLSSF